jgi:glutathione S-transferase
MVRPLQFPSAAGMPAPRPFSMQPGMAMPLYAGPQRLGRFREDVSVIKLLQFPSAFNVPNPSPFCMKAEMLLKMAGLPYETVVTPDPRRGPKGKLPAIADDGPLIGDSEIIRWHLEREYGVDFDKGLSEAERATAHAFARLLEERTYWVIVYSRWIAAENWPLIRRAFFGALPPAVRDIVARLMRRKVRRDLAGQGIGRHAEADIYALGVGDMRALAAQLGDKPFFMGSEPTGADATVYAFLANVIDTPFDSPVKQEALRHANLLDYARRMRARYFA